MNLTVEDVFKYVEYLTECVEKELEHTHDDSTDDILVKLKLLLQGNHVRSFVDGLAEHKVIIPVYHKIEEIDDYLDELYIRHLSLPYPQEMFIKDQRKKERASRMTFMMLLLWLCGFELVLND